MKVLDYWPHLNGRPYPGLKKALEPHVLFNSTASGIDELLSSLELCRPELLLGDFGVMSPQHITRDEEWLREVRDKYPWLPILVCGTSQYSFRWNSVAQQLKIGYQAMPTNLTVGCLTNGISKALSLIPKHLR